MAGRRGCAPARLTVESVCGLEIRRRTHTAGRHNHSTIRWSHLPHRYRNAEELLSERPSFCPGIRRRQADSDLSGRDQTTTLSLLELLSRSKRIRLLEYAG